MRVSNCVGCKLFPCKDVKRKAYVVPGIELDPEKISIVLISEAAPAEKSDYYYARGNPLFAETTVQAFQDAGLNVTSIQDILDLGVYLTTAIKCGKTGYGIATNTVRECSQILEQEITLFPRVKVFLLMGDAAIKAINSIARRLGQERVIPAGSTYKIREGKYFFQGKRALPSYVQAGPSFFIERVKRRTIAADIAEAFRLI